MPRLPPRWDFISSFPFPRSESWTPRPSAPAIPATVLLGCWGGGYRTSGSCSLQNFCNTPEARWRWRDAEEAATTHLPAHDPRVQRKKSLATSLHAAHADLEWDAAFGLSPLCLHTSPHTRATQPAGDQPDLWDHQTQAE